jgi:NADH-quinone oxidoreductase subunit L
VHGPAHVHHDEGRTLAAHGHDAHGHDGHAHGDHGHDAHHGGGLPKESPWVVTLPLMLLAVMSVVAGVWFIDPLLFDGYFGKAITVASHHPAMAELAHEWHGWVAFALHGFTSVPFLLLLGFRGGLVLLAGESVGARGVRPRPGAGLPPAGQQVLLRLVQ